MEKLILYGKYPSSCCNTNTILVRSRRGGYVTQNCSRCGIPNDISLHELPDLECGECGSELIKFLRRNYINRCDNCEAEWELHSLIPSWEELFQYHGHGLPTDQSHKKPQGVTKLPILLSLRHQPDGKLEIRLIKKTLPN